MPAKNPRVNVVLEKPLYSVLHRLAEDEGISMSMLMRDLVKEALEIREDQALADFAEQREDSFDRSKALSHEEVWGKRSQGTAPAALPDT
jgi:hypothetical protein